MIGANEGDATHLAAIDLRALGGSADWFSHTLISQGGANLRYRTMRDSCAAFHRHDGYAECFVVLAGSVLFDIEGGDTIQVEAGQFFAVPPGLCHRARVEGEAAMLVFDGARPA